MDIEFLLEKPLWQMTGREFVRLSQYADQKGETHSPTCVRIVGVRALAEHLACCESTVYMLRRNGVLDGAILSRVGKKLVFDGDKARKLAADFQQEQRLARRKNG